MNIQKQRSLEKMIAQNILDLQKNLFELTGSDLFKPTINNLVNPHRKINMYEEATILLNKIGTPTSLSGYNAIRFALVYLYENQSRKVLFSSELYPELGKLLRTTSAGAERAIRHAVQLSFQKGNRNFLQQLFPHKDSDAPSVVNSEFLNRSLEYIKNGY